MLIGYILSSTSIKGAALLVPNRLVVHIGPLPGGCSFRVKYAALSAARCAERLVPARRCATPFEENKKAPAACIAHDRGCHSQSKKPSANLAKGCHSRLIAYPSRAQLSHPPF
jgi:hypothetical protein